MTLNREIDFFWVGRQRRTKASILFFVNRYWSLVFNFIVLAGFIISPGQVGPLSLSVTQCTSAADAMIFTCRTQDHLRQDLPGAASLSGQLPA